MTQGKLPGLQAVHAFPLDLYGAVVIPNADAKVGDIVVNLPTSRRYVRDPRDLIRVSRVEPTGVYGFRVYPEDWERDVEYAIGEHEWRPPLTIVEKAE